MTFSTISVASVLGILMSTTSLFLLIKADYKDYKISGFIIGGGFLIHSFTGGLFVFVGIIAYFLIELIRTKRIKNFRNFMLFF